jgi:hypothetical protein
MFSIFYSAEKVKYDTQGSPVNSNREAAYFIVKLAEDEIHAEIYEKWGRT